MRKWLMQDAKNTLNVKDMLHCMKSYSKETRQPVVRWERKLRTEMPLWPLWLLSDAKQSHQQTCIYWTRHINTLQMEQNWQNKISSLFSLTGFHSAPIIRWYGRICRVICLVQFSEDIICLYVGVYVWKGYCTCPHKHTFSSLIGLNLNAYKAVRYDSVRTPVVIRSWLCRRG